MARESTIGTTFSLEKAQGTSAAVTAVTAGITTVVTSALASPLVGDFVILAGTNYIPLDRLAGHRVQAAAAGTFTVSTNTAGITGVTIGGSATAKKITFQDVCFAEFGANIPEPGDIDVTTMCDTVRKNVPGLANTGSATFSGPYDITDLGVQELIAAFKAANVRTLVWKTRGNQQAVMSGVVSSFMASPPSVEAAVTYSGTFQIQDGPYYLPIFP